MSRDNETLDDAKERAQRIINDLFRWRRDEDLDATEDAKAFVKRNVLSTVGALYPDEFTINGLLRAAGSELSEDVEDVDLEIRDLVYASYVDWVTGIDWEYEETGLSKGEFTTVHDYVQTFGRNA